jgi:Flp pilus assembly protein TadB
MPPPTAKGTTNETAYTYSYGADQREVAERLRRAYAPKTKEETNVERLKRLDKTVMRKANTQAMAIGVLGALILGVGMCLTMVFTNWFALGIVVGIAGLVICGVNWPLYQRAVARGRAQVRDEVLSLTDEILR